ncbi:unnamed protein product [Paramecium primaurelia]|uniref:LITAF domain-containing protein n=2 Tax=Paramecium TaxID=5884 RepID=A0A8S1VMM7_9CILI|nr:unnamed protein product [Paramecium primaurelia]CAD8178440.1 unnamed protein product [Paramecium pentaurelia]
MAQQIDFDNDNQLPFNTNGYTDSAVIMCFHCDQIGETKLVYQRGMWTYLMCIAMQCICGPLGSVVLFMNDCKDIYHICRNCKAIVGITEKQIKFQ